MTDKKVLPLFVVDTAPTVKWPVKVKVPVDGGEFAEFQFTGIFKRLSDAEYDAILDAVKTKLPEINPGELQTVELIAGKSRTEILADNALVFPQLMTGWEGIRTAAGVAVDFSIEQLRQQVTGKNGGALSVGIWHAINEIRYGAKLGN